MDRFNDNAIVLTKDELETIRKYNKLECLKDKEKKDNTLIVILGFMSALIGVVGIFVVTLLGSILEILEKIGGFA